MTTLGDRAVDAARRTSEGWSRRFNLRCLEAAANAIVELLAPSSAHKHKHYYVEESVGIAVGMLLTALHLSGLAALIHTPSPMRFLSETLDRPANEKAFAVIPVGYPAPDCEVPDLIRKSLTQVLVEI